MQAKPSLRERLGLHRPQLVAWALYDWANSAFFLVIVTGLFPIYYRSIATGVESEKAVQYFSWTTSAALAAAALAGPILGALGDFLGRRKQLMALFISLGVGATLAMGSLREGDWGLALWLFALGNIGVSTSFVFYDALLPHIASVDELDRVSTAGYALGYLGSGLLFIGNLWAIQHPEALGLADRGAAIRWSFVSVGLWWALFSIPMFRRVPEPRRALEGDESTALGAVRVTFTRLGETFRELRGSYSQAFLMLLATVVYMDGVNTIIRMATIYADSLHLEPDKVVLAVLLVQFIGIPFAFLFGLLAGRIGAKRSIIVALAVYCGISTLAYRMQTITDFYLLAALVGSVQGGVQALSRSLFATMVPKHKAAEMFGFFSVFERFASILGPLLFGAVSALTGSSRGAILSVIAFFVVGAAILLKVDVEKGRREAKASDEGLLPGT